MSSRLTPAQHDRACGSFLGLAIGDALGSTLEFSKRDNGIVVTDLVGGGPFNLEAGQWTDDTSMSICLAESLIANGGLNTIDLMRRFVKWWRDGENSVTGVCFDIGTTTSRALACYERTGQIAGNVIDLQQAGNGSLMRLAPVAIFAAPDEDLAVSLAMQQSRTTHPATVAHDACALFAALLVQAIAGCDKDTLLMPHPFDGASEIATIAGGCWRSKTRDEISSSGYVVHTLEAALWCVHQSDNFAEAVLLAANLGDDSDTVAAVTGQLAGAIWGRAGIPFSWREHVAWSTKIATLSEELAIAQRKL